MKAIILAAGLGTRLRPITNSIPKCLVPINGVPLLQLWLDKLVKLGVEEILINTHYFSEKVEDFVACYKYREIITLVNESTLLGTGGTLITNSEYWQGSTTLVLHADNYCEDDLTGLLKAHHERPSNCDATLLLFETNTPENCGVVQLSNTGVVEKFYEKVPNPPCNLASGALFVFSENVYEKYLSQFNSNHFYEISVDFVPLFINHIFTYKTPHTYVDIGTPYAYEQVQAQSKRASTLKLI
ncbi:nucleotidyltransferase family protein [Pseudoalteromonas piscicida]|uniref:nucleotidyltransferase family protein n=1 Tax=Pseudoalteromonas piscicida TaxID=43662 RepID=UPI00309CBEEF